MVMAIGVSLVILSFVQCSQEPPETMPVARAAMPSATTPQDSPTLPTPVAFPGNGTFTRVAKDAMASVVNISSTRKVSQSGKEAPSPFFNDPFFRRFFGEEFERPFRSPKKRPEQGLGSGVIVRSDGYIVTNHHVVAQADELTVLINGKQQYTAKLIGTDPKTDLAVIKVDAHDLPTLPWGNSDSLEVGEVVLAVGNPFGLNQTVTMGIISAVGRANMGIVDYEDFIQTDAAINPGNSGGALVNLQGALIGINTAIFSRTGGYMGIGFAIPSKMVKHVMDSLIERGKVVRGWLGVSIQELTPELAEQFGASEASGALVGEVVEESPAEEGGLKRADIVQQYNSIAVRDPTHLRSLVAETQPNTVVSIKILRNERSQMLSVTIGDMPRNMATQRQGAPGRTQGHHALSGIAVEPVPPGQVRGDRGVIITHVTPESPGERAGLRQGDVIVEINRMPIRHVRDFDQLTRQLATTSPVLLLLKRGQGTLYLSIKP